MVGSRLFADDRIVPASFVRIALSTTSFVSWSKVCLIPTVFFSGLVFLLGRGREARVLSQDAWLIHAAKCNGTHEAEGTRLHCDRGFERYS